MTVLDPILSLSATELSHRMHARDLSCREAMDAYLRQIDRLNPIFNAIVSRIDAAKLRLQADERDVELKAGQSRGWLHGMPLAVKDVCNTRGITTTFGSPLLASNVPHFDDIQAERLKGAGAIIIGKTNTPEFGLGSNTYNTVFGITGNAYDPRFTAGGSSGGAACALALRIVPIADGSDMMGSLRNPAGYNNVFGFRPSQGRVPYGPRGDQWVNQLGTEGPMGRTVEDMANLLSVQAGRDIRAPLSLAGAWPGEPMELERDLGRVRIGWLGDLDGYLAMEDGILERCTGALAQLDDANCSTEPVKPAFDPADAWQTWLTLRRWLVAGRLRDVWMDPAKRTRLKPEAQWEAAQGDALSAADVLAASTARTRIYQQLMSMFDQFDVLAIPSAQVWPFPVSTPWPKSIAGRFMDTYHRWMEATIYASLGGLPAVSVPVGFNAAGLPMGMQLIAKPQADLWLMRLARQYEMRADHVLSQKPPALSQTFQTHTDQENHDKPTRSHRH